MIDCKMCKKLFEPRNSRQKYCGSRNDKDGCSYKKRSPAKERREPKIPEMSKPILVPDYKNETITKEERL